MTTKLDTRTSEIKAHAEYSASGAERWLNCPPSHELSQKAPEAPESSYAAEGTEAHACFEFLLKNRHNLKVALTVARKTYSADMVEHAKAAVEWLAQRAANMPDAEILSETRVNSSPFLIEGQFGTLDAAIVEEFGRLLVCDYKYGAGIAVEPVDEDGNENPQLVYYALALSYAYNHNFQDVELVVIQPRAYHESGETIRSVVIPIDRLLSWHRRFRDGVMATSDKDAVFKTGKWCRFCRAAPICPELKDKALKDAQIAFSDTEGLASVPEPTMIKLPNLGTILQACDKLENWIERVREHARHVLERGGEVEGFKLVEKRGTRKWSDEEKTAAEARKKFGDRAFSQPKLLSPAQLEKAVKGADEFVAKRTKVEVSGTTVVPVTDKRPAVNTIEQVFGDKKASQNSN